METLSIGNAVIVTGESDKHMLGGTILTKQVTIGRMKRFLRQAEKNSTTGGTGATIVKLGEGPIERLAHAKKIGPIERAASDEICLAFFALSGGLAFKPLSFQKIDYGQPGEWKWQTAEAVRHYQSWAQHWSVRQKWGDPTLEIVIAAVIDERALYLIEEEIGIRHGLAGKVIGRGLRDYAARADWTNKHLAARWKAEATKSFWLRRTTY